MPKLESLVKKLITASLDLNNTGLDAILTPQGPILIGDARFTVPFSEARYRSLINRLGVMVLELSTSGLIVYSNSATSHLTGIATTELLGHNCLDIIKPSPLCVSMDRLQQEFLKNSELVDYQTGIVTEDNSVKVIAWNSFNIFDNDQRLNRIVYFGVDITERQLAEQELAIAAIAFETQEAMVISDAHNIILRVNNAYTLLTGYSSHEVIGKKTRLLKVDSHSSDFYTDKHKTIKNQGFWSGELYSQRKNGDQYQEYRTVKAVNNNEGVCTHYVSTHKDITEHKAAEIEIKRLAFYDSLTNLPNRRMLNDRLTSAIDSNFHSHLKGALLFLDLDDFKTLNDTLGHAYGDLLLQQVAQRLKACVRQSDTVARLGGDEFIVLLEDLNENSFEAKRLSEIIGHKILKSLNCEYQLNNHVYHCTPSIGATLFDGQELPEELIKQADIAMYEAKKSGRNTLCFFDPQMQANISARAAMEKDLRQALLENQFVLYYQPQVDDQDRIVSAEVLIRWQHPLHDMVSPLDFIPLVEETKLILPIGLWVLEIACAQLKKWENNPCFQHLQLAVNVSARQFHEDDFVEQVCIIMSKYAIKPHLLKLELTESLVLDNIDETIVKMHALKKMGVLFSMDDFGTGYSSLSYLTQLPLDQLKIDQCFVHNMSVKSSDAVIVQTIIGMAHNLGMDVIAEGVETEEQRDFLKLHGCPAIQGYLFSKPLPIEQFESLLYSNQSNSHHLKRVC